MSFKRSCAFAPKKLVKALLPFVAAGAIPNAYALDLGLDTKDVRVMFHNTLRYNAGVRVEKPDSVISSDIRNDESDLSVDRGELVMNRLDLLSELDFDYQKRFGFRLSGAAWYDFSFDRDVTTRAGYENVGAYTNNRYSNFTDRYYRGPSGEILDAYVYTNFKLGEMPALLRVGQQSVLWGEAVVLSNHSVSYNQTPSDSRKSISSPGATAKEQALPINQVYGSLQLTPEVSVEAQYYLDWKYNRNPEGGTYFGIGDALMMGPAQNCLSINGPCVKNVRIYEPDDRGDWGASLRWQPSWADGATIGFYARNFTERNSWIYANPPGGTYGFAFAEDVRLYGVSFSKSIAGVSVGAEIVKRENTALNSRNTTADLEGARGDTTHVLINGLAQFGGNSLWDSATLLLELGYSHLDRVTKNEGLFNACSRQPAGQSDTDYGCSSRDNLVMSWSTAANWVAVVPGWDLSAGFKGVYGLHGNAPVLSESSGKEGVGLYSVSVSAEYNTAHTFTLAYNDYFASNKANASGVGYYASNGGQLQDRGWVSFTYQTSF